METVIRRLRAANRQLCQLDMAIDRSVNTHGTHVHSNRREHLYARRDKCSSRAWKLFEDALEEGALAIIKAIGQSTLPTDTRRRWAHAAGTIGRLARIVSQRELVKAGLEPPGEMDVETATASEASSVA